MNRYEHERQKVESDCGDVDPIDVVAKVQKHWPNVDIVSMARQRKRRRTKTNEKMEELHGYTLNYDVYGEEVNQNSCVIS